MTMVSGNIKAIVPLFRERLTCDEANTLNANMMKFKRGKIEAIREKRIFGILTKSQVGYVPNVKVNFTETTDSFCQDTYKFLSVREVQIDPHSTASSNCVNIDLEQEYYREKVVNEYESL